MDPEQANKVFMMLGEMSSQLQEGARQRDAMFKKLDTMDEKITKNAGALELVQSAQTSLQAKVEKEVMPVIAAVKDAKAKGIGLMIGIGLSGGTVGAIASKALAKITGG